MKINLQQLAAIAGVTLNESQSSGPNTKMIVMWEDDWKECYAETMFGNIEKVKQIMIAKDHDESIDMAEVENSWEINDKGYFVEIVNPALNEEFGVWVFFVDKMLSLNGKAVLATGRVVDDVWDDWTDMGSSFSRNTKYKIMYDEAKCSRFKMV